MDGTLHLAVICVCVGVLSWCLRALPFLLFGRKGEPPAIVAYVGRVLSPAAIAMLVVYCFAGYAHNTPPGANMFFLPEVIAGLATAVLQIWRRNPMLSIIAGTAIYMALSALA